MSVVARLLKPASPLCVPPFSPSSSPTHRVVSQGPEAGRHANVQQHAHEPEAGEEAALLVHGLTDGCNEREEAKGGRQGEASVWERRGGASGQWSGAAVCPPLQLDDTLTEASTTGGYLDQRNDGGDEGTVHSGVGGRGGEPRVDAQRGVACRRGKGGGVSEHVRHE